MPSDPQALRRIAERATQGPWAVNGTRTKWRDASGLNVYDSHSIGSEKESIALVFYDPKQHAACWADAQFIAAFDPPTVLALLDKLARLEVNAKEAKASTVTGPQRGASTQ